MVNMVFGLIQDFTPGQRHIAPWTENVVFWVLNIALVGFVTTLLLNQPTGEKFFVPFQGAATPGGNRGLQHAAGGTARCLRRACQGHRRGLGSNPLTLR